MTTTPAPTFLRQAGVSVHFLCHVEQYLRETNQGDAVCVPPATLNRWIGLLGQVESEYRELAAASRKDEQR